MSTNTKESSVRNFFLLVIMPVVLAVVVSIAIFHALARIFVGCAAVISLIAIVYVLRGILSLRD